MICLFSTNDLFVDSAAAKDFTHILFHIQSTDLSAKLSTYLPMISGAHVIISSRDADKDRAFFQDVLDFPSVDAGHGWLIFALPPSELAVHPGEDDNEHTMYLTCDNIDSTVKYLESKKVKCGPKREMDWGKLVMITLPSGGKLGIYEPKHPQPH